MIRAQWMSALMVSISLGVAAQMARGELIVGSTFNFGLPGAGVVVFDTTAGSIVSSAPITGFLTGERAFGIDFRPATGELYTVTEENIYTLTLGGVATRLSGGTPFIILGDDLTFDFEPTTDRIRVLSERENLLLNPNADAAGLDSSHTPPEFPPGDPRFGASHPEFAGLSYTNSVAGATSTLLYGLDASGTPIQSVALVTVDPANDGRTNTIVMLSGDVVGAVGVRGLEVSPATGIAYMAALVTATGGDAHGALFRVDLSTGVATRIGPDFPFGFSDIAVIPEPGAILLAGCGTMLVRRRQK